MELNLYNNISNTNVVNKKLEFLKTINFKMKEDNSIIYPSLVLRGYESGNYCYIPQLKRYYYIKNIELMNGNLYRLDLEVDVLMSYKDSILKNNYYTSEENITIKNNIDYTDLLDYNQFILNIGG